MKKKRDDEPLRHTRTIELRKWWQAQTRCPLTRAGVGGEWTRRDEPRRETAIHVVRPIRSPSHHLEKTRLVSQSSVLSSNDLRPHQPPVPQPQPLTRTSSYAYVVQHFWSSPAIVTSPTLDSLRLSPLRISAVRRAGPMPSGERCGRSRTVLGWEPEKEPFKTGKRATSELVWHIPPCYPTWCALYVAEYNTLRYPTPKGTFRRTPRM